MERPGLRDLGITHVLNAAEGKWNNVLTGADYYSDMNIHYYGIEADDKPTFNISQFFHPAAQFVHEALSQPQSESEQVKTSEMKPLNASAACLQLIISLLLHSRQRAGALRDGSQQVSDPGVGIFDDGAQLICGGCCRACATTPLHPAEPRLPEAAQSAGHHIARRQAEAKKRDTGAEEPHIVVSTTPIDILYASLHFVPLNCFVFKSLLVLSLYTELRAFLKKKKKSVILKEC